jgi:hypothetical protein
VKVGEQGIDDAKPVPGLDEECRLGHSRPQRPAGRGGLEGAHGRGADCHDAPAAGACRPDPVGGGRRQRVAFRRHAVRREIAAADRQERPRPHMQRERHVVDARIARRREQRRCEVQAGRGCGDGAGDARERGLVALPVGGGRPARPADVRWQGHLAGTLEPGEHIPAHVEPEPPPPVTQRPSPLARALREMQALAHARAAPDQRFPLAAAARLEEEELEAPAARASTVHPRRHDARVVQDEQVARP